MVPNIIRYGGHPRLRWYVILIVNCNSGMRVGHASVGSVVIVRFNSYSIVL